MRITGIIASGALLVLSLLGWAWLSGVAAPLGLPPAGWNAATLGYALPATGAAAGLSAATLILLFRRRGTLSSEAGGAGTAGEWTANQPTAEDEARARQSRSDRAALLLGLALAGIVILLLAAAARGEIKPVSAALVLICGTLALLAGSYVLEGLARGDKIEVSSHWGGLGGSLGGWGLSPITALLLLALVFLGATILAGRSDEEALPDNSLTNQSGTGSAIALPSRQRPPAQAPAGTAGGTAPAVRNDAADAGNTSTAANQTSVQATANLVAGVRP